MPANLPPQFFQLQSKLNKTKDIQEKIAILKEMLAVCPKHKGTERVQEEIKKKIAKLKRSLPKKLKREQIYFVEKEGAAQILLIGLPNCGKTSLLNALCQTHFKVADYPFSTQIPQPAILKYENLTFQLVDCPPLTEDFKPGWLKNLAKQSDLILALLDAKNWEKEKEILEKIFEEWQIEKEKIFWVANKSDLIKNQNAFPLFFVSAKEKINLEKLKKEIFKKLKIIRVYPKDPFKEVDFQNPIVLKEGATLKEFVKEINEEWLFSFKKARLYDKDLKNFILVGKDYLLKDGDIIELKF